LKRLRPNISDGWLVSIKDRLMRQYGVKPSQEKTTQEEPAAVSAQQSSTKDVKKPPARGPRAKG